MQRQARGIQEPSSQERLETFHNHMEEVMTAAHRPGPSFTRPRPAPAATVPVSVEQAPATASHRISRIPFADPAVRRVTSNITTRSPLTGVRTDPPLRNPFAED